MMLDEAIKHYLEVAEQNETQADKIGRQLIGSAIDKYATDCRECAADHRQLAEWLSELKELRNSVGAVKLELLKEVQAELEKRGNMLYDAIAELEEAKRLLKAAVEDMHIEDMCDACVKRIPNSPIHCPDGSNCFVWRYKDEALKLIES